jgi:hypothetical protein
LQPTQLADWLQAEGRYLANLICGSLHWWGICDLAFNQQNQLLAFRLTPLTNFLFQGRPLAQDMLNTEPAPEPALTVTADNQILLPSHPAYWSLITSVEAFAEIAGVREEQLCYCLTARSLGKAISQGQDPAALLALLQDADGTDETGQVKALLASLRLKFSNYGRVRLYTDVALLQTADTHVTQQLTALTDLEAQILQTIAPNLFLLKQSGIEELLDELKKRGQVPLLHEEVWHDRAK